MNKMCMILMFLFLTSKMYSNDSLKLDSKIKIIQDQLEEVKRDQLNYRIEKDLIRETYKVNYDRINLGITFILGVIAVFGYIGIKDVNAIKKQFNSELDNLVKLRQDFETKIKEIDLQKNNYESSLKEINEINKSQNDKLKVIEIKEKIKKCLDENEFTHALEYSVVALELSPKDTDLLKTRSLIYNRLGRFDESKKSLQKVLELEPEDQSVELDLIEVLIFNKEITLAKDMMEKNENILSKKAEGKVKIFFNILISYLTVDFLQLKEIIKTEINQYDLEAKSNKINGWNTKDALYFVSYNPIETKTELMKNFIWFTDGQFSGKEVLERIEKISTN